MNSKIKQVVGLAVILAAAAVACFALGAVVGLVFHAAYAVSWLVNAGFSLVAGVTQ